MSDMRYSVLYNVTRFNTYVCAYLHQEFIIYLYYELLLTQIYMTTGVCLRKAVLSELLIV